MFHNVRRKIEDITSFFQYAAAAPERIYGWERDNLASREKLLAENKIFSAKEIQLNAELAKESKKPIDNTVFLSIGLNVLKI